MPQQIYAAQRRSLINSRVESNVKHMTTATKLRRFFPRGLSSANPILNSIFFSLSLSPRHVTLIWNPDQWLCWSSRNRAHMRHDAKIKRKSNIYFFIWKTPHTQWEGQAYRIRYWFLIFYDHVRVYVSIKYFMLRSYEREEKALFPPFAICDWTIMAMMCLRRWGGKVDSLQLTYYVTSYHTRSNEIWGWKKSRPEWDNIWNL